MRKTVAYFDTVTRVLSVVTPTNRVLFHDTIPGHGAPVTRITERLKRKGFTVAEPTPYAYGLQFDVI